MTTFFRHVCASTLVLSIVLMFSLARPTLAANDTLDPKAVADLQLKTVRVIAVDTAGAGRRESTGFVWPSSDSIATSLHGVVGAETITVEYCLAGRIKTTTAQIVRALPNADLALLRVADAPKILPCEMRVGPTAAGESLWAVGYPLGTLGLRSRRLAESEIAPRRLGDGLDTIAHNEISKLGFPNLSLSILPIEGNVLPGDSGGPIVDASGRLVGIVDGGLRKGTVGIAWGIRADQLTALRDSNVPIPRIDASGARSITSIFSAQATPAEVEQVYWESVRQENSIWSYTQYLDKYPNGEFHNLAESAVASIQAQHQTAFTYVRRGEQYINDTGILVDVESYNRAIDNFQQAIKAYPDCEQAHFGLGYCQYQLAIAIQATDANKDAPIGAFKAALTSLNRAIDLNAKNAEAYLYRAYTYENLGDRKYACEDYIAFQRLKDNLPLSTYRHHLELGRFTKAYLKYHGADPPDDIEYIDPERVKHPPEPLDVRAKKGDRDAMAALIHQSNFSALKVFTRDETQAMEASVYWAEQLARLNDPRGLYELGEMYANARGKPKDAKQAAVLFQRAADMNDRMALESLGYYYFYGRGGLPIDEQKAHDIWAKAATLAERGLASSIDNFRQWVTNRQNDIKNLDTTRARIRDRRIVGWQFYLTVLDLCDVGEAAKAALPDLVDRYRNTNDHNIRNDILTAFQSIPASTPDEIQLLIEIVSQKLPVDDPDIVRRDEARWEYLRSIEVLNDIGPDASRASAALEAKLSCADRVVRMYVVGALGEVGTDECIAKLERLSADPSHMVASEVPRAIAKIEMRTGKRKAEGTGGGAPRTVR